MDTVSQCGFFDNIASWRMVPLCWVSPRRPSHSQWGTDCRSTGQEWNKSFPKRAVKRKKITTVLISLYKTICQNQSRSWLWFMFGFASTFVFPAFEKYLGQFNLNVNVFFVIEIYILIYYIYICLYVLLLDLWDIMGYIYICLYILLWDFLCELL